MLFELLGWRLSLLVCLGIVAGVVGIVVGRLIRHSTPIPVPASEADTGEWPAVRG